MACCILIAALFGAGLLVWRGLQRLVGRPITQGPAWRPGQPPPEAALRRHLRSFGYALAGLRFVLATQPHARFHAIATTTVSFLAVYLNVRAADALWLLAAMALVWMAEILNTAIEHLCDVVSPGPSISVKRAKDVAAGAVLAAAAFAALVGGVILLPYLWDGAAISLSRLCVAGR